MSEPSADDSDEEMNSGGEEIDENLIAEIKTKIDQNPLDYQAHVQLIHALRSAGELDELRVARERMHSFYPLAPKLWLDWIRDEIHVQTEMSKIETLFQCAVEEYVSVDVWLEYVQWACGCGDIEKTRNIFESSLLAAGLNVAKGAVLWDAYREFESALLTLYDPEMGAGYSQSSFDEQKQRLKKLFRRQLNLPLIGIEDAYKEFIEFLGQEQVDPTVETNYQSALKVLDTLRPFEQALASTDPPKLELYKKYLDFESTQKSPSRLQALFERAITDHCLDVDLWIRYTTWLDREIKSRDQIVTTYQRATANCTWSNQIWRNYLLALERNQVEWSKIESTFDKALQMGYSTCSECAELFLTFCYQKRRNVLQKGSNVDEDLRKIFERGAAFLKEKFGEHDWDADFVYRKSWARAEAQMLKNVENFRRLWEEMLHKGGGRFAAVWLEYLQLERQFGDVENSRKLLYRAINSASDFPESVFYALLQFEKEEGTLDEYDRAVLKVEHQSQRANERRAKTAVKETTSPKYKKREVNDGGRGKKKMEEVDKKSFGDKKRKGDKELDQERFAKKRKNNQEREVGVVETKREKSDVDDGFFAVPSVPVLDKTGKMEIGPSTSSAAPAAPSSSSSTVGGARDTSRYDRTVFVSNLDFKVSESELREIFSQIGPVTDVRLVMLRPDRSKGYGYVEFENPSFIEEALKLDRHLIDNRPMYVSKCVDKSSATAVTSGSVPTSKALKFNTGLEKNKLFVKNIPREVGESELDDIFRPFENLVSVRLVVHKSGQSKGLAYVEFSDETSAAKALLKTDGTFLHGRRLSVDVSNPPPRRNAQESREFSSAAAKSFSLMTPRSVTSKPKLGHETVAKPPAANENGVKPKSNDEFRNLFKK